MKAIIAFTLFLAASALIKDMGTWTADTDSKFAKMSLEEKRKLTGTIIPLRRTFQDEDWTGVDGNFQQFDARQQWPNFVHPVLDQEQCGSCWAFGASESLSDRTAIATNGQVNVVLSPQTLVSCDTNGNFGCGGGYLNLAWEYMQQSGIYSLACEPYTSGDGETGACPAGCASDSEKAVLYYAGLAAALGTPGPAQQAISTLGPIETAFDVYEDFFSYCGGVYTQTSDQFVGGHAVKVIGYGYSTNATTNYWLAQNSWGTTWGCIGGYFMIADGQCGFNTGFIAGPYATAPSVSYF